jgi:signal transduction histidine kinase
MFSHLISVQYCYTYLIDQIPVSLLLYSHIPGAIISLFFGGYVLYKKRDSSSLALFIVCLSFALWCVCDIISWFSFMGSGNIMFVWSSLFLLGLIIFFSSYYFLYTFITKKDLPTWQKIVGTILLLPMTVWTFSGSSLLFYDANSCVAIENDFITGYYYFVQALLLLLIVLLILIKYIKTKDTFIKKEIIFIGIGMVTFLSFLFSSTLLVSILGNSDASSYVYNYEIYGLFGMPILIAFLAYTVVKFKAFNIKLLATQVLVWALVILIGAEFLFIQDNVTKVLASVTLVLAGVLGLIIVRASKREDAHLAEIEKLAENLKITNEKLEIANRQISEFAAFASHEIRTPATVLRGVASEALEGDFGPLSPVIKDKMQKFYVESGDIIDLVNMYLEKSKGELGQMRYDFTPFDMKDMLKGIVNDFQPNAEQQGVVLTDITQVDDTYRLSADQGKLRQVFRNIVGNAVKFTPKGGSVTASVTKNGDKILVKVVDTGNGISKEKISKLFKEFSRVGAKEANLSGSGLGLFVSKGFIDAHQGRIWAESEGEGKGSTFFVELPTKQDVKVLN